MNMDQVPDLKYRTRNIGFILLGTAILMLKSRYSGPFEVPVHSYAGNVAVSFAVYFWALLIPAGSKYGKAFAALLALAIVELFEIFDGFGFMSNTYDPLDLLANLAGVSIAWGIDTALTTKSMKSRRKEISS